MITAWLSKLAGSMTSKLALITALAGSLIAGYAMHAESLREQGRNEIRLDWAKHGQTVSEQIIEQQQTAVKNHAILSERLAEIERKKNAEIAAVTASRDALIRGLLHNKAGSDQDRPDQATSDSETSSGGGGQGIRFATRNETDEDHIRENARAEVIRQGLIACYAAYDATTD